MADLVDHATAIATYAMQVDAPDSLERVKSLTIVTDQGIGRMYLL